VLVSLTYAFSIKTRDFKKLVPYECGFNPFSSARIMFDVHFFIVALLFLVFDVELIFLYP
jgi:NADH-quinone oxidoreductase subunit A